MNIARINMNKGAEPSPGYQGDETRFRDLEALVGRPLPASYIEFVRTHDGGHPEADSFLPPGETNYDYAFGVNHFYTISDGLECIFNELDSWRETLGEGMLPVANDGGNNQYYLNLNETEPSVWAWIHDVGDPDEDEIDGDELDEDEFDERRESVARIKVADSFETFIDGLTINPDLR